MTHSESNPSGTLENVRDNDDDIRTGTDANRDPISGAPGAHPVSVGAGAAAGAAAGAGIGALGGPVGAAIGGVVGAVAGGLVGKGAGEAINPTTEDAYWREQHTKREYYDRNMSYDDYAPAYRYGWESYSQNRAAGRNFDDIEADLGRKWESRRSLSRLSWDKAKQATRDAWNRVEQVVPSDSDRDGR